MIYIDILFSYLMLNSVFNIYFLKIRYKFYIYRIINTNIFKNMSKLLF